MLHGANTGTEAQPALYRMICGQAADVSWTIPEPVP